MTPEQWRQIERIYNAALERDIDERIAFIAQACGEDHALRREVGSLLAARDEMGSFLVSPAPKTVAGLIVEEQAQLAEGRQISHYRVLSLLGVGGMGEVYLAQDMVLGRRVALKLLPREFTEDRERVQRFEREARAASALNHPNIITIHEIGQVGDIHFIAAEYIEGETLRQRIEQRTIKLPESLDAGIQIAGALADAHRAGVVHRDIKPENLMLRRDGIVKVLDFGLAKVSGQPAEEIAGGESDAASSRKGDTIPGTVMGTRAYMSPEQARGEEMDARTDIFSLGVVLYEMLAGRAPFEGATTKEMAAAILDRDAPPLVAYSREVPAELQRIVSRAMAKNCEDRYQSVEDLAMELRRLKHDLEFQQEIAREAMVAPRKGVVDRRWIPAAAGVVLIASIALGLYWLLAQSQSQISAPAPRVVPFTTFPNTEYEPALSPDGNQVAFVWRGEKDDNSDVYVKRIDDGTVLRVTTDPASDSHPTWSPDGNQIAFVRVSEGRVEFRRVPSQGGVERKVADAHLYGIERTPVNPHWSPDGKFMAIVDKSSPKEPYSIFLLSVENGEKRKLTSPPAAMFGDHIPAFSPDGKTLAFTRVSTYGAEHLHLVPVAGGEPRRLTFENRVIHGLTWTADGREIVFSSNRSGGFSLWRIQTTGGAPEQVAAAGGNAYFPSISPRGGRLVYTQEYDDANIWRIEVSVTTGRGGAPARLIASARNDTEPQFSPDGNRIVFTSDQFGSPELWVCDREGSNISRLTYFNGPHVAEPRWSPDGRHIAFISTAEGSRDIYVIGAEGGAPHRLTTEPSTDRRPSWSSDGRWIYFGSNRGGDWRIWKIPAEGGQAVQVTKNGGQEATESPDGRFLYYSKGYDIPGIWRTPVAGGEETRVLDRARLGKWVLVEQGIYFINPKAGSRPTIEFLSFATSRATQIAALEKEPPSTGRGLTVSPDGRWILYVQMDQVVSDVMLVENFR